jgi:hypothetical protein
VRAATRLKCNTLSADDVVAAATFLRRRDGTSLFMKRTNNPRELAIVEVVIQRCKCDAEHQPGNGDAGLRHGARWHKTMIPPRQTRPTDCRETSVCSALVAAACVRAAHRRAGAACRM